MPRWILPVLLVLTLTACAPQGTITVPTISGPGAGVISTWMPTAPSGSETEEPEMCCATEPPTSAELQAIVDQHIDPQGPSVIVLIDSPEFGRAVAHQGLADIDAGTVVRVDDRFRIASVSKTMLAVIMLQLAEEGEISLDDAAADYLPDEIVENIENVDQATIRQLLNHTSGIDDYLGTDEFWNALDGHQDQVWTPAEALTYAYDLPALFEVGEGYSYSNSNYLLLQLIAEEVSGQPYGALIREGIAEPLGLQNTYAEHFETRDGGTVRAYTGGAGDWEDVTDYNDGTGLGDGGVITTAADLAAYMQALVSGDTLISDESRAEMQEWVDDEEGGLYGLGLSAYDYGAAGQVIGHSGTASGFGAEMWYVEDAEATIIILFASEDVQSESGEALFDALVEWVSGR